MLGGLFLVASRNMAQATSEAIAESRAMGKPRFLPAMIDRANTSSMTSIFLSPKGAVLEMVSVTPCSSIVAVLKLWVMRATPLVPMASA